jgi:hypothetical protein
MVVVMVVELEGVVNAEILIRLPSRDLTVPVHSCQWDSDSLMLLNYDRKKTFP